MNCSSCGSERTFQFSGSIPAAPPPERLPLVCRDCNVITIDGKPVDLPEVLSQPIVEMAKKSELSGKQAREDLEERAKFDPERRIDTYMTNFFKGAYLDGFFRALAFFRHNAKEGRLRRIRELWEQGLLVDLFEEEGGATIVAFPAAAYTEFVQLLYLSAAPGEANAQSHSNKRAS